MKSGDNLTESNNCSCLEGNYYYGDFIESNIGMDRYFAEISVLQCKKCTRNWLRYYYIHEAFTGSGRWFHGLIDQNIISLFIFSCKNFYSRLYFIKTHKFVVLSFN